MAEITIFYQVVLMFRVVFFSLRYIIRGDDEEWNEVLNKAGQDASVVSLKRLVLGHSHLRGVL